MVGEALIWTLERGLANAFTPEVERAWVRVYLLMAATMQAGADEAPPCRRRSNLSNRYPLSISRPTPIDDRLQRFPVHRKSLRDPCLLGGRASAAPSPGPFSTRAR